MVRGWRQLDQAVRDLKRLERDLPKLPARAFKRRAAEFERRAIEIVYDVVYAAYDPFVYNRTDAMLRNTVVEIDQKGNLDVKIKDSPELAAIKTPTRIYPIFMLPEYSSQSFFRGRARPSIPRDFLGAWLKAFTPLAFDAVLHQLDAEMAV